VIGPGRVGVCAGTRDAGAGPAGAGTGDGLCGEGGGGEGAGIGTVPDGMDPDGAGVGGTPCVGVADSPIRTSAGGPCPGSERPVRAPLMTSTARMTPIPTAALASSVPRVADVMTHTLPTSSGPEMSRR
jgi:hypothetical protein